MLITFSGLDGAGKSTLIEWLQARLEHEGHGVLVLHMNDDVGLYAYLRSLRDRVFGGARPSAGANGTAVSNQTKPGSRASAPGPIRRARNALVWNKPLRRLIYPVDLVLFLGYRLFHEKLKHRILIMDRYFYDTLVDVADGRNWFWVRLLKRITPTPQVTVFLDVTPEESFKRKGEYDVEYLRRRWVAYKRVFPWIPSSLTVRNGDLEATKLILQRAVDRCLPSR